MLFDGILLLMIFIFAIILFSICKELELLEDARWRNRLHVDLLKKRLDQMEQDMKEILPK